MTKSKDPEILKALEQSPKGLTYDQIAAKVNCDKTNLSKTAKRLEGQDLVTVLKTRPVLVKINSLTNNELTNNNQLTKNDTLTNNELTNSQNPSDNKIEEISDIIAQPQEPQINEVSDIQDDSLTNNELINSDQLTKNHTLTNNELTKKSKGLRIQDQKILELEDKINAIQSKLETLTLSPKVANEAFSKAFWTVWDDFAQSVDSVFKPSKWPSKNNEWKVIKSEILKHKRIAEEN